MVFVGLYDSAFAALAVMANADGLIVGDSVGPNALGLESTEQVTLDHMVHHASAVRRGAPTTPIIVDLPIRTQRQPPEQAVADSLHLWRAVKIDAIKLEGSEPEVTTLSAALANAGITVCAHLVREQTSMEGHIEAARAMKGARVCAAVLQGFSLGESEGLRSACGVPTIGVEQRGNCDGVVMNAYRALGILPQRDSQSRSHAPGSYIADALSRAVEALRRGE
jgi:3-methyl-2-oxobutanoate hydroxymethyltransferase